MLIMDRFICSIIILIFLILPSSRQEFHKYELYQLALKQGLSVEEIASLIEDGIRRFKRDVNPTQSSNGTKVAVPQAAECGINGKTMETITKKSKSGARDWPWIAVLLHKKNFVNFGGGVLLNRDYILTAAHCFKTIKIEDVIVRLGEYDLSSPNETKYQDLEIKELKKHSFYDDVTDRHDIALLKLNRSVQYDEYIRPVCLPYNEMEVNQTAVVAGWGSVFYGGQTSDTLLEVPVPIWNNSVCKTKYSQTIFPTNICAAGYGGGEDSCVGDSGGPLAVQLTSGRWFNIGIVSWGIDCGVKDQPGIYTKVIDYLDWIKENIYDSSP